MLYGPCLKLCDINRIGQSPRRLVSKFWPPRVTQQVDDLLPAVLFRPMAITNPCLGLTSLRPTARELLDAGSDHENRRQRSARPVAAGHPNG
jgi:hypothetical protein